MRSSNCDVRPFVVCCVLSPSHAFFCVDWGGAFLVHGLVRSVPRPWTSAERPSPSCGALKTWRFSKSDAPPPPGNLFFLNKKVLSVPFLTLAETKILVLLSALVERFGVSRIQDFFHSWENHEWRFSKNWPLWAKSIYKSKCMYVCVYEAPSALSGKDIIFNLKEN